jgi:hypothetical protein
VNGDHRAYSQGRGSYGQPSSNANSANKQRSFSTSRKDSLSKNSNANTPSKNSKRVQQSNNQPFSPVPNNQSNVNEVQTTNGKINTSRNSQNMPAFSPISDNQSSYRDSKMGIQTQRGPSIGYSQKEAHLQKLAATLGTYRASDNQSLSEFDCLDVSESGSRFDTFSPDKRV